MGNDRDNAYGAMMKDQSLELHLEPDVRTAVTSARSDLEGFFASGLDAKLPFLNGALGDTPEGEAVVRFLTEKRSELSMEMTTQSDTVGDIHDLMQMSLGIIEHADKNS